MSRWRLMAGLGCLATLAMSGCGANYSWRSSVPQEMRTVAVPTFRNESDVNELGAVAARQLLREFQREGTFRIRRVGDAALEVQGVIESVSLRCGGYDRRTETRVRSYGFSAKARISVIDKRQRKVLVDNRAYEATAQLTGVQDLSTAQRDASGRLADDLARQVVDDLLDLDFEKGLAK